MPGIGQVIFWVLLSLIYKTLAKTSIGPAIQFKGTEDDLDVTMDQVFPEEGTQEVVDLSWCFRASFDSLHTQQVMKVGNNTGLYLEKVRI